MQHVGSYLTGLPDARRNCSFIFRYFLPLASLACLFQFGLAPPLTSKQHHSYTKVSFDIFSPVSALWKEKIKLAEHELIFESQIHYQLRICKNSRPRSIIPILTADLFWSLRLMVLGQHRRRSRA